MSVSENNLTTRAETAILAAANAFGDAVSDAEYSDLITWIESDSAYKSPKTPYKRPRYPTMPVYLSIHGETGKSELTLTLVVSQTPDSSAFVEAVLFGDHELVFENPGAVKDAMLDWAVAEAEDVLHRYAQDIPVSIH